MALQSVSVFEVAIGRGNIDGGVRVEVINSPAGEASAVTNLDSERLLAQREKLEQAVLASAVMTRRVLPETERYMRDVGHVLFSALLDSGDVAGRYRASVAVAAERGQSLRIVLRVDDPILAGLPWEAMYDEATGNYVCRRDQLVRYVQVPSSAAPLTVEPPLRILGVVSAPYGLPPLDVEKEKAQLEQALARWTGGGLAQVTWAPSATWADLQDMLLGDTWHVLHFIGHGDFDPSRDEGVLALTGGDGRAELVEASRLVDLLRQARPVPRLVMLNSCSGAAPGVTDFFSGTAAALVRGGVSAVAAMQYEVSDPAAVAFARGFYGAIAHGRGVDEAVSAGRVAIIGLSGRTLEWMTPVLYLRGNDSRLFTIPALTASSGALHIQRRDSRPYPVYTGVDPAAVCAEDPSVSAPSGTSASQPTMPVPAKPVPANQADPPDKPRAETIPPDRGTATGNEPHPAVGMRRSRNTKRVMSMTGAVVAVAVAVVVALLLVNEPSHAHAGSSGQTGSPSPSTTASGTLARVVDETTRVPESTLDAIGVGTTYAQALAPVTDTPLTAQGKPELLYISAAWCPYCAADQWAMTVALSRFGTFTRIQFGRSAPSPEELPNTATLSFYGTNYSSKYLSFNSVEAATVTFEELQAPTQAEHTVWQKYDRTGNFPFIDAGNKYTGGSLYNPAVLKGMNQQEIAAALSNPSSPVAKAIDGSANELIAAVCDLTNGQPGSVCNSSTITAAHRYL